jgi:para-nitrobenzyl esterase
MIVKQIILFMCIAFSSVAMSQQPPPLVFAGGEKLEGEYSNLAPEVAVFKGVPFAAAPINERRWQAPAPHQPRAGKQSAKKFAAGCFQDNYNTQWYQKVGAAFGASADVFVDPRFSEDCLYLNIWTPTLQKDKKLPVMVWIHGGSNKSGWSFENNYWGDNLAQKGDVVVVSIAYRLGVFGFFSHSELSQSDAPANFGILDQISALSWIQKNIRQFGGNPANVTVFGESAGAADIGYLMLTPLAEGLFHRAISQSGGFQLWENVSLAQQKMLGDQLAHSFGIMDNSLTTLKTFSAEQVFNQMKQQFPEYHFSAVIDHNVLSAPAITLLEQRLMKVDLLIGSNQDEWLMYLDNSSLKLAETIASHPPAIQALLKTRAEQEKTVVRGHDQISTLIDMVCPAYEYAKRVGKSDKKAYVYRFKRIRQGRGGEQLGAYHGAEIPYVFDSHDPWFNSSVKDLELTSVMLRYWSNFARTGDPNPSQITDLTWPRFEARNPKIMDLSEKSEVVAATDFNLCQQIAPHLKLAVL